MSKIKVEVWEYSIDTLDWFSLFLYKTALCLEDCASLLGKLQEISTFTWQVVKKILKTHTCISVYNTQ